MINGCFFNEILNENKTTANVSLPLNRILDVVHFGREWLRVDIIDAENETAARIESRKQMTNEANRMFSFICCLSAIKCKPLSNHFPRHSNTGTAVDIDAQTYVRRFACAKNENKKRKNYTHTHST